MYKNFRVFITPNNTYIVRADSKRFGKQAIVFESYDIKHCIKWIYENYRNKDGKVITNSRLTDRIYRKAMSTLNTSNNPWFKEDQTEVIYDSKKVDTYINFETIDYDSYEEAELYGEDISDGEITEEYVDTEQYGEVSELGGMDDEQ